jgi:hypothetical protein
MPGGSQGTSRTRAVGELDPMSHPAMCPDCATMLANPTREPPHMDKHLARSPLLDETKRKDGVMVSLWRCICGQLWQRERFADGEQFWLPQAEPAPPSISTSSRRPRF